MLKFTQMSNLPGAPTKRDTNRIYYLLFFLSGFPALLYQIVWQRALFTLYGVTIESVTIIVTVFMLGLGFGSLAGGWLSSRPRIRLLLAFGLIEFSVGTFGFASLWIFHRIGALTAGASTLSTGLISFALLLVPTMLMGSTLPLLVEHFVRRTGNVGESVGLLYSVNTLGSGAASLWAEQLSASAPDVDVLLRYGKSNGWLDDQPAMITRRVGKGRVTYLGAVLDPDLMRKVVAWATSDAHLEPEFPEVPADVEVNRLESSVRTVYILINHGSGVAHVALPNAMSDVLHDNSSHVTSVDLEPQGVAVLESNAR